MWSMSAAYFAGCDGSSKSCDYWAHGHWSFALDCSRSAYFGPPHGTVNLQPAVIEVAPAESAQFGLAQPGKCDKCYRQKVIEGFRRLQHREDFIERTHFHPRFGANAFYADILHRVHTVEHAFTLRVLA